MNNTRYWYLISYDIADPRRLQRLQRWLRRHALMLQESVYLYQGTHSQWKDVEQTLQQRIHNREDDVKVYRLPPDRCFTFYGARPWPRDVFFGGYPKSQCLTLPVEGRQDRDTQQSVGPLPD